MPSKAAKAYFAMARGLNTEAPLINFPDGYTTEEENYELTIQGARRRRPGLALEQGGEVIDIVEGYNQGDPVRVFDWENVAGIPTINLLVMQVGYLLHIFEDTNPVSPTRSLVTLDIRPYSVADATDAQIAGHPLEAAFGRGHLFMFGKYTNPFYIEYDPDTELFSITQIDVEERDFVGIDDGVDNSGQPAAPTDSHTYNLRNRGWTQAFIDAFQADQSRQPSKAMIPFLGLVRAVTASNHYNLDGVRSFSPDKLVAELFQDASAPTGHFIKTPFDSTSTPDSNNSQPVVTWIVTGGGDPTAPFTDITITVGAAHGLSVSDEVDISGMIWTYNTTDGIPYLPWIQVDGTFTVTNVPSATKFRIAVPFPGAWPFESWNNQYYALGTVTGAGVPNPSGNVVDFRPKAGAFFAGRTWFGGIDTARLGGRVYFSQVIENDDQYGKCYQVADPTDERISDLVPSDGGVIVIPEASNVLKLVPHSSSLLVYASNGVWEIGPGDLGYFAATSYSVRKVTDSGAVSAGACLLLDNLPVYFSTTDIFALERDFRSGYLNAKNLTESVINTYYNGISLESRREAIGVFDDLGKRLIWLYRSESGIPYAYDKALVYDDRLQAFTSHKFGYEPENYLANVFILKEAGETAKVKYVGIMESGTELHISEPSNSTTYMDWDIKEPECYMITGYDSLRDPASMKEAPIVQVFSRKTETGYGPAPDYEPVRPSSTSMRARWDWADNVSASKWGRYQEVYRHPRTYIPAVPASDGFDDGAPLVISTNRLRGRGRVLQLEFRAGVGTDSYILGWKTNFTKGDG